MKDIVTASLIVFVPLCILWPDVTQAHLLAVYLGSFICLALLVSDSNNLLASNKFITLFLLYVAGWFSYWLSGHYVGMFGIELVWTGINEIMVLISFTIIYYSIVTSRKELHWWFNFICVSVLIQALIAICQHWWFNPIESVLSLVTTVDYSSYGNKTTAAGSLANTNYLGAFLAVGVVFFARRRWWPIMLIVLYALALTTCRAAIIAVIFVGTFWAVKYSWKFDRWIKYVFGIVLGLLVAASCYAAVRHPGSLIVRYNEFWLGPARVWVSSWHTFLFGVGPGVLSRSNNFLHSEPIAMIWNYGLIGLSILTAYIISVLIKLRHPLLLSAFVIILIDMQLNHIFHIPTTALLCVFVMALIQKQMRGDRCLNNELI